MHVIFISFLYLFFACTWMPKTNCQVYYIWWQLKNGNSFIKNWPCTNHKSKWENKTQNQSQLYFWDINLHIFDFNLCEIDLGQLDLCEGARLETELSLFKQKKYSKISRPEISLLPFNKQNYTKIIQQNRSACTSFTLPPNQSEIKEKLKKKATFQHTTIYKVVLIMTFPMKNYEIGSGSLLACCFSNDKYSIQ